MLTNDQWGLRAISQEMLKKFILDMNLKMTNILQQLQLLGAIELTW